MVLMIPLNMSRVVQPLKDTRAQSAKAADKDYKLADGGGLFLLVKTSGSKLWRLKYKKPDGREGLAALGAYPVVTIALARVRRLEFLRLVATGVDPVKKIKTPVKNRFDSIAKEWFDTQKKWSSDHAVKVFRRFEIHLFPELGGMNIEKIKPLDLVRVLGVVEQSGKFDVAARLKNYLVSVFRFCVHRGLLQYNPASDLGGVAVSVKVKHRPALPLTRLPELLNKIESAPIRLTTRYAILLQLHTFVRSSELRMARWHEFNLDDGLWTIPAHREAIEGVKFSHRGTKMRVEHLVPLSSAVIEILNNLRLHTGETDIILPGDHKDWLPMSEMTINKALQCMGYDTKIDVCCHGFRAMACGALNESGLFSLDAVERQMSHQERSGVRAAYMHKAEFLVERKKIMSWWSDYLQKNYGGYIHPWAFKNIP